MKGLWGAIPAIALIAACSASGTTNGGDYRFDAAPPPPPPEPDSGFVPDGGDAGAATWSALYNDYFGSAWPQGPGCAGDGACHGAPDQIGAQSSNGYYCPPAADGGPSGKDVCLAQMKQGAFGSTKLIDTASPSTSALLTIIRHRDNTGQVTGSMPQRPTTYVFDANAIQRITTWMANGANND